MNLRVVRRVVMSAATIAVAGWSGWTVVTAGHSPWSRVWGLEMSVRDAAVMVHVVLLVASMLLFMDLHRLGRSGGTTSSDGAVRPVGLLVVGLAVAPGGPAVELTPPPTVVPAGTLVSPAVAAAVMERILRTRREQVRRGVHPDRLSSVEMRLLGEVMRSGQGRIPADQCSTEDAVSRSPDLVALLAAVDRKAPTSAFIVSEDVGEWRAQLRVLGHPVVHNRSGEEARFRKSRALELLVWSAMNRDRCRRSAARTAIWEMDVSDSTFSTVISEMRRALGEVATLPDGEHWCPPTFSDRIVLSPRLITDSELLAHSLARLRQGHVQPREVAQELAHVRDIPFAGTTYSWADLDGTTTRLVLLVVEAVREVVSAAMADSDPQSVLIATAAGLRVLPGCEEFLEMQAATVPTARSRRAGHAPVPTLGR